MIIYIESPRNGQQNPRTNKWIHQCCRMQDQLLKLIVFYISPWKKGNKND